MNLAHIHLLLNHFPTIGFIIGLGLLSYSLLTKSIDIKRVSLMVLMGIGILTIPTYVSGNAAAEALAGMPNISMDTIHAHETGAMIALGFIELVGGLAWLGLWQYRRHTRISNALIGAIIVLGLISLGIVSNAANIGGDIRHPEIMDKGEIIAPNNLARQVGLFVTGQRWMWPTCETLHFIGLSLLLGVVFFVDLRMLGIMKNVSFKAVHRILPWGVLGFGVNVLTGMLFFIGAPEQYTQNGTFHWKLILVLIAGANALYFTVFDEPWELKAGEDAPLTAKAVAIMAMVLWLGVMYCGDMLPFLGNAF